MDVIDDCTYVFVTGSRHAESPHERVLVFLELGSYKPGSTVLCHGDARGIDHIARDAAIGLRWRGVLPVPARWKAFKKQAGPLRNTLLVDLASSLRNVGFQVDFHAFPASDSRGTWDCVKKARAAKFDVAIHELGSTTTPPPAPRPAHGFSGDEIIEAASCPSCNAQRGEMCRDFLDFMRPPHEARTKAAGYVLIGEQPDDAADAWDDPGGDHGV